MTTVMMTAATVMMTAERPDEAFSLSSLFPDSGECHPVEPNPLQITLRHNHGTSRKFQKDDAGESRVNVPGGCSMSKWEGAMRAFFA